MAAAAGVEAKFVELDHGVAVVDWTATVRSVVMGWKNEKSLLSTATLDLTVPGTSAAAVVKTAAVVGLPKVVVTTTLGVETSKAYLEPGR